VPERAFCHDNCKKVPGFIGLLLTRKIPSTPKPKAIGSIRLPHPLNANHPRNFKLSRNFLNMDSARFGAANNVAVATTSTAAASSAFASNTYQIRVSAPANCFIKIGDGTPTAANTDALLPSTWVDYITVSPGQKISVFSPTIQTVSVTEITG
jgi:hypothetical protein